MGLDGTVEDVKRRVVTEHYADVLHLNDARRRVKLFLGGNETELGELFEKGNEERLYMLATYLRSERLAQGGEAFGYQDSEEPPVVVYALVDLSVVRVPQELDSSVDEIGERLKQTLPAAFFRKERWGLFESNKERNARAVRYAQKMQQGNNANAGAGAGFQHPPAPPPPPPPPPHHAAGGNDDDDDDEGDNDDVVSGPDDDADANDIALNELLGLSACSVTRTHTLGYFSDTSRLSRVCENTAYLNTFSNLLSKFGLKC
jgi:hypothetical protein